MEENTMNYLIKLKKLEFLMPMLKFMIQDYQQGNLMTNIDLINSFERKEAAKKLAMLLNEIEKRK